MEEPVWGSPPDEKTSIKPPQWMLAVVVAAIVLMAVTFICLLWFGLSFGDFVRLELTIPIAALIAITIFALWRRDDDEWSR